MIPSTLLSGAIREVPKIALSREASAGSWNAVKSRIQNSRKVQNLSAV